MRLDVAVHDTVAVGEVQSLGHEHHELGGGAVALRGIAAEALRGTGALQLELGSQVVPGDQLHREVVIVAGLADLVDRRNTRVLELGGRLGFAHEARHARLVEREVARHDLDCHFALEALLPGAEDDARAPGAELFEQLEVA